MRIEFGKIEMYNFMSFENEVFDFSMHKGMSLVCGKNNDIPNSRNGAGKSALFSSLLYILFGQLQSKIKNENILNRYGDDKDMRLVLNLRNDSGSYKIIRGISKGRSSYLNLYLVENGVETDITKSTIQESQEFIESEIIHCDITIFLRTILLTADQTYNFYMLKKADKKDFVEKLFDISVFGDIYALIHRDILDLDKVILRDQTKLLDLNKNVSDYTERMTEYDKSSKDKIKLLESEIEKVRSELKIISESEVATDTALVDKYNKALELLTSKQKKAYDEMRKTESEISSEKSQIRQYEFVKKSSTDVISKHKDILSKLCNDCKPMFKSYYNLNKYAADLRSASDKIEECKGRIETLESSLKAMSNENEAITSKIDKANLKIRELTSAANDRSKKIGILESKIESLTNDKSRSESNANPYVDMLNSAKKSVSDVNSELSKIESKYKYLKFAESVVSQDTLRKFIIKDLISLLNNKIKLYLTKLGAKYYVVFDENMDYEFMTEGGTCEFQNFSAGERMRIMIATSFAFRDFMSIRNGLNSNILVLDEYFDSAIDSLCVESIISILKEYSEMLKQNVYVISHRQEVSSDSFDRVIQVEKTDNISKVTFI